MRASADVLDPVASSGRWYPRVPARTYALRFLVSAAAVAAIVLVRPVPWLTGDGLEYAAVVVAWINHASPDIRAEDVSPLPTLFEPEGYTGLHPNTVVTTNVGRLYAVHFWLYSLVCAPAALLLRALGANPLTAFAATNTLLFVAIAAAATWSTRLTSRDRALIALAAVSPVVRFLHIAHPEAFTWACVLASLVAINHARYAAAAACAACGAMQNPPVASLALYCVIVAARERGWHGAIVPAAGATLALLPPVFFWCVIGHLNPLVERGFVDVSWGVADRVWGLLVDLDQGLLAYVPGLLILATARARRAASLRHWGMLVVFCLLLTGASTNIGANSPFPGLMRYAIWMVPVLAWLATESTRQTPRARVVLVLTLALHAALLVPTPPGPHAHGRLATYALSHRAAWYRPAPGVFADRELALDFAAPGRLPIGFVRDDGVITKLLVDAESLPRLDRLFAADPAYLRGAAAHSAGRSKPFYLNPPRAAVRSRCAVTGIGAEQFRRAIGVKVIDAPATSTTRRVYPVVEVTNHGEQPLCNLGSGGRVAFNLTFVVRQGGDVLRKGLRTRGPQILMPGESTQQALWVALPPGGGRYDIDILPVLETVGWGDVGDTLLVDVRSIEPSYQAAITVAR